MKNKNEESEMKHYQRMEERHERIRKYHERKLKHSTRVIVKGYMRPDGTSYHVVIPKEVREQFGLKGGEYFLIRARPRMRARVAVRIARAVEPSFFPTKSLPLLEVSDFSWIFCVMLLSMLF